MANELSAKELETRLQAVGVEVDAKTTSQATMRAALQNFATADGKSPQEIFSMLDTDNSGYLDRQEMEQASGILGVSLGTLMTQQEQEKAFREMDPDVRNQLICTAATFLSRPQPPSRGLAL